MAEVVKVSVYGTPDGWKPPTKKQHHPTTWLEWELPVEVEKLATKYIKQELKKFNSKCKCEYCNPKNKK